MKILFQFILSVIITCLFSCNNSHQPSENEIKLETYCNHRFEYCIDYPSVLNPQGESDNGDGQVFQSKDGENKLTVYRDGRDYLYNDTEKMIPLAFGEDTLPAHPAILKHITYKKLGKKFYVISGTIQNKIFYQKTIRKEDNLITCLIEYKNADTSFYNKVSALIFQSFR